ncbi:MAG TPA: hypothetical protein VF598_06955 [Hymenobacter sp.]
MSYLKQKRLCASQHVSTTQAQRLQIRFVVVLSFVLSLGLLPSGVRGQGVLIDRMPNTKPSPKTAERVYTYAEIMPVYRNGGNAGLTSFCKNTFHVATPAGAKGLFLSFVVDPTGKPGKPSLSTRPENISIPESTRQEVLRGFSKIGEFVPGKQSNYPVSVQLTVLLAGSAQ